MMAVVHCRQFPLSCMQGCILPVKGDRILRAETAVYRRFPSALLAAKYRASRHKRPPVPAFLAEVYLSHDPPATGKISVAFAGRAVEHGQQLYMSTRYKN